MNNDDALYLLGIEGADDTDAVRQAYERRRLEFEQRLTNTSNEGLKHKYHSTLSDLDQAYRMLLSSSDSIPDPTVRREQRSKMRSANSSAVGSHASTGGTLLRSEGDAFAATSGLTIGHVLAGRYEIRRVLGQGGMGAVYEAFDQLKQESVAIKVLLPQYLGSEQGRDRFMHEAKVACRLAHPNIVKVFDVGLAEPYHFITMELLEGETLRAQMERRKADRETYSAAAVLDCARQLIEALDYAHKQIVHRDLKPENVWVSPDGTLKLIDFGIARAFTKSALTRTGMVMGTAYYMAPEQFDGAKDVDWRADQYSLAVILYELLTGRVPLGTFAATSELRKDVPISLSRALMKALSPDASNRFDSLANFRTALSSRNTTRFFNRKPIAWSVAAAAMLVVVGLLVGGVFRRAPQSIATSSAVSTSPAVAATALEGEVLSLFKRLQDKEQEIADNVTQQQLRYDHAAATQAAREYRELQLRHEIQQETQDTVFSERQWSASSGQIHAGQALLQTHDVAEATAQLTAARDTLLGNAKLADDIENFVRARADYFDARQPWLDYSLKHAGISPTNPAIHAAEATIQAKIDRGEFAALASDVFPRLAGLYTDELRSAQQREEQQRSAKVTGKPTRPDAVQTPSEAADEPRIPTQNTAPETKSAEKSAPLTKREIKAQRKRDALMEKCAKTHYRSHGCPPAPASN